MKSCCSSHVSSSRPRALFMAFGTKGDVFPIAAIAAALACDQKHYEVILITHSAHQGLSVHLRKKNVSFIPISTPPVLSCSAEGDSTESILQTFSIRKENIKKQHRQECLSAFEKVFADGLNREGDFVVINFFALEGWNLAELFQVRCVVAAPYAVPYSPPSSFERRFRNELPSLYKYFQEAPTNKVCWHEIVHWMWPLFTEDWASWRTNDLQLSRFPYLDPVTNLPMWHVQPESSQLLYGFSKEIVECPGYWPSTVHICGFWFLPMEWQFSCEKCSEVLSVGSPRTKSLKSELCEEHSGLENFLTETSCSSPPIVIGLNSIGSMGFLKNPQAFLMVIRAFLEMTGHKIILLSARYKPLDEAIRSMEDGLSKSHKQECFPVSEDSGLLFDNQLFCFSGTIPYSWLFSKMCSCNPSWGQSSSDACDKSGSTAAALHAGIPQFYWAERLCWLGVAPESLKKQHLFPDNDDTASIEQAAQALTKAVKLALSPEIKSQATTIAERLSAEDGVREALQVIKEKVIYQLQTPG